MKGHQGTEGGGKQPVMIATDIAARGLDFTGHVSYHAHAHGRLYVHNKGRSAWGTCVTLVALAGHLCVMLVRDACARLGVCVHV